MKRVRFDESNERCIYLWDESASETFGPVVELPQDVYDRLLSAKAEFNAAQAAVREAVSSQLI